MFNRKCETSPIGQKGRHGERSLVSKDRETRDRGRTDWSIVRRFVEASQDCIWILSPEGLVDYVNPRAETLLGAVGNARPNLRDLWPEENRFTLERAVKAAAAGQAYRFRTFLHDREQTRAYWETVISAVRDNDGAITGLLAVGRDVTHEVETESFLTSVIQLLPSPLSVKNVADRRFVLVNRAAEELLGASAEEALGHTAEELNHGGAERLRAWEDEVLAAGEMRAFDHEVLAEDGPRHFSVKLLATHDDLGPRHLIALGDDVTEQLKSAEALRAALKAAEQASEAKSAFLANMSHELRTPLNGIVAGADMLARDGLSPRGRELAEMIRASGETLERLVSDILDLARIEAGQMAMEPAPFHVGETVRSAAALFRLEAERKGLALDVDVAASLDGVALGDMGRLRQVLANLLSNAVKFTATGQVRLRAERTAGGLARFIVEDTGQGFAAHDKARIFGRFQQADETFTRRFGGAGLGLAISRELVGLMGGNLDAEGIPGAGATFWFEIPAPPTTVVDAGPEPKEEAAPTAGLRILLADDHPTNRQVVRLMLGEVAGIASVENGAEAVEAFAASRFDLVLMDMQMPVMDGLTAVREIRRLEDARGLARTPIVMLTANTRPEHLEASLAAGADRHLAKPITAAILFSTLEEVLAGVPDPAAEDPDLYPNFGHQRP